MRLLLTLCFMLSCPALGVSLESPSLETGRTLFESPHLGTSGKSCVGCHPQGQGLRGAQYLDDQALVKMINLCIRKPLQGEPLDPASTEMDSLVLYLRSLFPKSP